MTNPGNEAIGGLYAIVDPAGADDLLGFTAAVVRGGAAVVQLRDKSKSVGQIYERAVAMQAVCRELGAIFIVNDRLDVALACGADGVHLGPEDLPVKAARAVVPEGFIIGGSAGTVERARQLEAGGADYLGVGAVFEARASKPDASAPRGPAVITSVVDAVEIPVVGIGGIGLENAAEVIDAGAAGVAVIRALSDADDPQAAAAALAKRIEN